ncbi:O-antigen ligase family protein [Flavonifractor plautii]|uniref:O-antigen ligase family protein n=2 Tax=Flavonifractor plautii TaxID=292800 RepID=UPI001EDEF13B|nr:O-antigen ligase family protein [Flavonifractor plautii]MCG4707652.1 O-antigen ligase family protein [Flavonifractor plautii]
MKSKSLATEKTKQAIKAPLTIWKASLPFFLGAVLFLMVCLCSASTIKPATMVLAVGVPILTFLCFTQLRDRMGVPLLLLAAVVLMDGISTLYAVSGKFALYEFLKVLASFCLVLFLLAIAPGKGVQPGRWIATLLETCAALASLVSIDMLSTRWISTPVLALLERFTQDYSALSGVEAGVRMTSIFENPNVFAGCVGIAVLLSLGLIQSSKTNWEKRIHQVLLFLNALAFVLAFSMGATGTIAVAFLALLALEQKEKRAGLLILMLETLVLTLVCAALISMTSFEVWSGVQPIPLLCLLVGSAILCGMDHWLGGPLSKHMEGRGKLILALTGGVLAALVVFAVAAYNITGPVSLQRGEGLRRAAYPEPGTYTLAVEADAGLTVTIESQNQQETMMHTSTELYRGEASGAQFAVPEDSLVVYFNFSAPETVRVESVTYQNEEASGSVPLGYRLLPGFIANRLQGLFANENAIQRVVFFADGLKLFQRSPVIGLGMGAFENGVRSVQSFYYETKYVHNHYIQALVETGVVGLALFLLLLGGSAAAVWRARKRTVVHPLVPALGATLVFMAGHAATEVVFSSYPYLPMAFGVFALISLCCEESKIKLSQMAKTASCLAASALIGVYAVLLGCNMYAQRLFNGNPTGEDLTVAVSMDRFEWADYALSYVLSVSSAGDVDPSVRQQADEYAERLAEVDSNTIPIYLAQYYFLTGRTQEALDMVEQYVDYVSSDPETWQTAFDLLDQYEQDTDDYRTGVQYIAWKLDTWNQENMGEITVDEEARAFIARMGS